VGVEQGSDQIRKVLEFLHVDSSFVPAALDVTKKQTTKALSEGIVDYEEVVTAFKLHPKMMQFL
jgi:hypothetical protein